MYTDSHCHPENKRFDGDRADVFARAKQAGVTTMLAIGNAVNKVTAANEEAQAMSEYVDQHLQAIREHATRERVNRL